MPEKGVTSTFKKIVYESSEMVFLADDTYPYTIFYGNDLFEKEIGDKLEQRNLVGLGLDVNSYIFKEELVLEVKETEYSFSLELPHENESNYFLFYRGKPLEANETPTKAEAVEYVRSNPEAIIIGEFDFITFLNATALSKMDFKYEELVNTCLVNLIHPEDQKSFSKVWKKAKEAQSTEEATARFQTKENSFVSLDLKISFTGERFFITTFTKQALQIINPADAVQNRLIQSSADLLEVGKWEYDSEANSFQLDEIARQMLELPKVVKLDKKKVDKLIRSALKSLVKGLAKNDQGEVYLELTAPKKFKVTWEHYIVDLNQKKIAGIVWNDTTIQEAKSELDFFQTLFMDSLEAMILLTESGVVRLINSEAKRLFDFDESNSPKFLEDFSPFVLDDESVKSWIENPSIEGVEILTSIKNQQGDALNLAIKSKRIASNKETCIVVSFRNVTEKISLERSLEDSTEFLMNLTDQVPGGLYQMVLSAEGEIRFAFLSKGIRSVLGISSEEAQSLKDIGMAMSNVHPQDLPNVIMTSVASARKLEPWLCQFRVKIGDSGEYRWVLGAARPQTLDSGDMVWYGYLTDISQQKEFEEKLDEAKKAAEKANQIKSDFLSMISHELRTPLNAISGSVYSLLQESPTDYQKNALNTINFAVDNLIIMINDLLDFQKIEAGKLHMENASFNLSELLNQIIKGLTFHARDSKNKLQLDLDPRLDLLVKGDKTRMSQVLNNLITNALKFTDRGIVAVKVNLLSKSDQKARVYFEVLDNGIGIAKEDQGKIFDDFDQVKPTFNKKYGGTGLGLSITKKLLSIMGSEIHLESEVGVGSKFYFEIEMTLANEKEEPRTILPMKPVLPEKLHLLMAEDNEVNALVLGKIITKWGHTYDRVVNGLEAVAAMDDQTKPNCVLMDIQMPEMNGFDATKAIKAQFEIPVIALTAAAKLEIMEQIQECGFDGFVAKPIDAAELHDVIKEVVGKYHSRP